MVKKPKKVPIRRVDTLPEDTVLNEVIFNRGDGCFYLGVENNKVEVKKDGNNLEETGV